MKQQATLRVNAAPLVPHLFASHEFSLELSSSWSQASSPAAAGIDNDELALRVSEELWERLPADIAVVVGAYRGSQSLAKISLVSVSERDTKVARYATITVADSRVAAHLHRVLSKHHFLSLVIGRISRPGADPSRQQEKGAKAATKKSKHELPDPNRMNLDNDDYENIVKRVAECDEFGCPELSLFRIATELEDAEFTVTHVAQFVDRHVRFAGWLDAAGAPSAFAIAVFMLHRCHLSVDELTKLVSSTSKLKPFVKLAIGVYARFVLPPEELPFVLVPLLRDTSIIPITFDDDDATDSIQEYARKLITESEVCEAFFPVYPNPDACREAFERAQQHVKEQEELDGAVDHLRAAADSESANGGGAAAPTSKGTLMGFRSAKELREFMEMHHRLRQAQVNLRNITSGVAEEDFEGLDVSFANAEEDGDAGVGIGTNEVDAAGAGERTDLLQAQLARKRKRRERQRLRGEGSSFDELRFLHANLQKMLAMAGRTEPFKKDDPIFFRF